MIAAIELLAVVLVLVVTMGVGTVVHELSHALVLEAVDVPYDVTWLPGGDASGFFARAVFTTWASVTPRRSSPRVSPGGLRTSAMAPLSLVVVPLVVHTLLPTALSSNLLVVVATVAWVGCALPSPQDFSLFWHADEVVDGSRDATRADG